MTALANKYLRYFLTIPIIISLFSHKVNTS